MHAIRAAVSNNTQTTTQARMTAWVMDSTSCPGMLMNASYSQVGVAVAVDATPTYIVLFR